MENEGRKFPRAMSRSKNSIQARNTEPLAAAMGTMVGSQMESLAEHRGFFLGGFEPEMLCQLVAGSSLGPGKARTISERKWFHAGFMDQLLVAIMQTPCCEAKHWHHVHPANVQHVIWMSAQISSFNSSWQMVPAKSNDIMTSLRVIIPTPGVSYQLTSQR